MIHSRRRCERPSVEILHFSTRGLFHEDQIKVMREVNGHGLNGQRVSRDLDPDLRAIQSLSRE
jgi:hypothetical protein